jgi:hypothetical protein
MPSSDNERDVAPGGDIAHDIGEQISRRQPAHRGRQCLHGLAWSDPVQLGGLFEYSSRIVRHVAKQFTLGRCKHHA